ncbi:branched-chain amino acid ABC transporter, permease protein [Gleimia coleocanis DSM 15436]|uniref:Branched-chain amino acid ABC transporter, permease protein n=1 Tax=Gleimia coleocanis DSM 15436 TaxID=525245 RepID=C0W103_9ACTO|nr:ABC transporter permease [Gleimia coleocanis]EEH63727.1 branched-chain amino acid ABC transporter, permease protein [Gleimia coleocanis DSM 15436]
MSTVETTERNDVRVKLALRDPITATVMTVLTAIIAATSSGISHITWRGATKWFEIPETHVPARPFTLVMLVAAIALTVLIWNAALKRKKINGWYLVGVAIAFVLAFLVFTVAGKSDAHLPMIALLTGALSFAVPLVFGSLSGVVCERSGVINIAIEGQLLFGAFLGVVVASLTSSPVLGLFGATLAGALVAVLLALFTVNFRTDHIIVGVVLNVLVLGLTSFLYSTVLKENEASLNAVHALPKLPIPVLSDIPVVGPVLFNQTILVYLMFIAVILLQFLVYNSRWGLRMRACGEHPKAADTVGIKVNRTRWQNVILGGAIAGLGGAFFTLGQGLAFSKDMTAGAGFIALAAMILGRWNPRGAFGAALLFGFATNLGATMQTVQAGLPAEFLLMIPYVITILAVAGFVGAVKAPAAEGKPYPA